MRFIFRTDKKNGPSVETALENVAYIKLTNYSVVACDYLGDEIETVASVRTTMFDSVYYTLEGDQMDYDQLIIKP